MQAVSRFRKFITDLRISDWVEEGKKTRQQRDSSKRPTVVIPYLAEHNKSAVTDHATQENHVINWP